MSDPIRPVQSHTLPDQCADQLRSAIVAGRLSPGDRLPSEAKLSAELGVARLTLRSALARLVAEDLIEVRHGSGYTVRPWLRSGSPKVLAEVVSLAAEQGHTRAVATELLRIRRYLAGALVERLAEVQPVPLDAARVALAHFEQAAITGADAATLAEADADILEALVTAAGSPVLQLCIHPVRQILAATPALRAAMYAAPLDNVRAWSAFIEAVAADVATDPTLLLALLAARDAQTVRALETP